MDVLQVVATREGFKLEMAVAAKVAGHAQRNLRRAVLMLEACKVQQYVAGRPWLLVLIAYRRAGRP